MSYVHCLLFSVLFLARAGLLWGHGRLLDPASRSSMWRVGFNTTVNYNDNGLNCGGYGIQWGPNHGKCGMCGDPYNGPRDNEAGGKYATGQIVSHYVPGQDIMVTVELTVNHGGYFEFYLCPVNNPNIKATESCFSRYPVMMKDGRKRFIIIHRNHHFYSMPLRLPPHLSCQQCVFRWKYVTATSWGCEGGRCCTGCGPQEEFYGCADVSIQYPPRFRRTTRAAPQPTTTRTTTTKNIIRRTTHGIQNRSKCRAKFPWRNNPTATPWCIQHCARNHCNTYYCEESCFRMKNWFNKATLFSGRFENSFWDGIIGASNETIKSLSYQGHL